MTAFYSPAQIGLAYGYSSTGVGVGKVYPAFKSEVNTNPWNNFILRNGIFEVQFAEGNYTYGQIGDENYESDKGQLFSIGAIIPLHRYRILQRKGYWRGFHVVPMMGVHYSTQVMGDVGQAGFNLAPGLSIQFPLGMIDIKLKNGFYFNNKDKMEKYRGGGYLFTPSIGIQLDGMFERLGGSSVSAGEFQTTWRVLESEEVEYDDDYTNFRLKTTRRNYSYRSSSGGTSRKVQKAFWYLSGAYNKGRSSLLFGYDDKEKAVRLIPDGSGWGLSVGGRWRDFMIDLGVERNSGFYAVRDPKFISELEDFASAFPLVEGEFNALEIRGKIGFDIVSAIGQIVAKRQVRKLKDLDFPWVKFMRFNVGLSGGLGLPGKTKMLTSNGEQLLDDFFTANPEVERNELTDIMQNNAAWTIGLFMNWEMGPISVGWDWHGHHEFGWRTGVGIRYMLPLNQLKNF